MSLSDFSTVMKARAYLNKDPGIIKDWTDTLGNSIEVPNADSNKKALLGQASSLMIQDESTMVDGKPFSISKFRNLGQALSHNIAVVTEEGLRRHWDYYGLKMPIITDSSVTVGMDKYIGKPLLKAYIIWYNTIYKNKNKSSLELFSNTESTDNVDEATGVKYASTYSNTASTMVKFLKACGLSDELCKQYGQTFQVGHIESQAFIKLKATKQASSFYNNSFIDKIIQLHEYLDLASSSLRPEYKALTASVLKGTVDRGNLFIHVEMQLKDLKSKQDGRIGILESNTNQGSGRLSRALNFVSILRDIGSRPPVTTEDKFVLRQINQDTEVIIVKLNELYKNYKAHIKEVRKALYSSFPNNKAEIRKFLLDLKSSKTLREHIKDTVLATLTNSKIEPFTANLKDVPIKSFDSTILKSKELEAVIKTSSTRIKQNLAKLKTIKKKAIEPVGPALNLKDSSGPNFTMPTDLLNLQNLINQSLAKTIQKNMGTGNRRDVLNYRTGRFATSANVELMSISRAGMITAYYNYMRNPYVTFSTGGAQESPKTRDPKLLIAGSIREIAQSHVTNRMRSVLV